MNRNAAYGAVAMTFFGLCWMLAGLTLEHAASAVPVLLSMAVAFFLGSWSMRLLRTIPPTEIDPLRKSSIAKRFNLVNAAQWILIAATVFVLFHVHHSDYIPLAISVIVALHFIPLASLFQLPLYYVTAVAILAVDVASVVRKEAASELCQATALVLWMTTVWLLRALSRAERESSAA